MKKTLKAILAVILVAVTGFCFAGCHRKNEIALKIGDTEFTSAFYSCALISADGEAREIVSKQMEQISVDATNKYYIDKAINGVAYSDWVKNRAIEFCKEIIAAKNLCEQNGVATADYLEEAKNSAEYYWSAGVSQYYEENGVALDTYKQFAAYSAYKTAYFDYLYGEKGTNAISKEDLEKYISDNYIYIDYYTEDVSEMTSEKYNEKKAELQKYADRIKGGEAFGKILSEIQGQSYTADSTDTNSFSHTYATVIGAEGSAYENELFETLKPIPTGEIALADYTQSRTGGRYIILTYKFDILNEKNPNLDVIKDNARWDLKGDELDAAVKELANSITIQEITYATKQFKVEKIYYPEGAEA